MYYAADLLEYHAMNFFPRLNLRRIAGAIVCLSGLALLAAPAVAQQPGPMGFAFAHNVYALSDTSSLIELTYQYAARGLKYERIDGRRIGRLLVAFRIWDSTGKLIIEDAWVTSSAEPDKDDEDHALLGVKLFGVRPGKHRAQIMYEDMSNARQSDSATFELPVRSFAGGGIALSDIQVISEITPSDDQSNRFYKNGYVIYPNVLSTIEPPFLLLNTYLEIYRANTVPTSEFEMIYALSDSSGRVIYAKEEKRPRPTADAIVDVHSLVIDELPSGTYSLVVKAYAGLRGAASDSAMVVRWFTVSNPDKDVQLASAGATTVPVEVDPMYAGLTEPELDAEFERFKYITVAREREIWSSLNGASAKARFMTEFWHRRDPDPGTAKNELREDYLARIAVADKMYNEPLVDAGHKSDRGRVMLQYGKPNEVDRHYFDKNRKPYEIWHYQKDGEMFVFVDRSGMGRFVLVHSTAPGEVRQENWLTLYATVHENFDR